ncbi:N-acetyl-gamma-glutamyl-phosphate reductase [Nitritalea halalkaliphila LW7]|uniref:N-acetyl-gamma-glutamyl-phosphate reductase n=1 Tax=Nitritalea halalkaliphila LW7 TaxID=1189621 RepID=I5C386_9BACT|nr:N-acetyl-gamma-glutamyl-phosphate reductase [Nitritalea halalkaliphila]EIM76288.1 N-acetyl-gamma-glutamyl-phosphate reductase [Nitritalea halalkaliphila LW7]
MKKIKTAVIGAAGYTGGELLRLLVHHPHCELIKVHSNSQKGKAVAEVHPDLLGDCDLQFTGDTDVRGMDVVFLGLPHGESKHFVHSQSWDPQTRIIDLSTDFRDESDDFVYGLPELNAERIASAQRIANPGCFATAIQLALLPAAAAGLLQGAPVHVTALTGSTGAGKKLSETAHFSYRDNNLSVYKLFDHQHLKEIRQSLRYIRKEEAPELLFVPYRGNFTRGIWVTAYFPFSGSTAEAHALYADFYKDAAFTHVSEQDISLKQVVNTNKGILHVQAKAGQLVVYAAIDNLLKGASGQAVHNMNLAFGLPERTGLHLKASAF